MRVADPWGVLVWNMALMSPGPYAAEENMAHLWELIDRYNVKVALLNEASVPHLKAADAVPTEESDGPLVTFSEEGILGRDFWTDDDGVRKAWNRTRWSSAVMSPLGTHAIGEGDVKARSSSRRKPIDIAFTNSRPGTWIAATVQVGEEQVTCVSLYGLVEELTDASMHRSLSEVSPLFSDPDYSGSVLLGGDFNVSTGLADASDRERSRVVLDRIEAYDLVDCLKSWRKEHRLPPMPGCRCVDDPCLHTLTRVTPQESGADLPWVKRFPIQVDYLFASRQLADRLDDVVELPPEEWERFSDHRPIVAMFCAT